jgi:arabinofuranosyltransferase
VSERSSLARGLLIAQLLLAVAVLAWQGPAWWQQRWVQDDAYVSFRYARNLVRGEGVVYNAGDRVEGYTNFLWTLLAAVPLARGAADPLPFMHAVSAALWAGAFALLLALGTGLWRAGVWAAPLAALPLAVHWSFNLWFVSGMETPLVTFCIVAAVAAMTLDPRRHGWAPAAASLAAVALIMTRPDGVVVSAALAAGGAVLDGAWLLRTRAGRRALLGAALPVLALLLPYEAWRITYYGALFPNTYYAKAAYLPFWSRGLYYLRTYVAIYGLWPFLPLAVLGLGLSAPGAVRRFLLMAVLAGAATALYVARLGGDFMEWRFLAPVSGVVYPAIVVGAAAAATHWRGRAAGWAGGAATAALLTAVTLHATTAAQTRMIEDQETIPLLRRYTDPGRFDWRTAARVFDEVLPRDVHIATTSAGIIPYFCDRPCLDLHGLTDARIGRQPVDPRSRGRLGHEHWLQDLAAIRARGVDVVLEWADPNLYPRAVATPPRDGGELVSVALPDQRYVDFTLLDPALRARLVDPRLVFYDARVVGDPHRLQAQAERYAGWRLVDRLDWGDGDAEAAHAVSETQPADAPYAHSWHTKLLRYRPPLDGMQLQDDGRRIYGEARWEVTGVNADADLVVVARTDHTGGGRYDLEVNGRPLAEPLVTPWRPDEWWSEDAVVVPRALLVPGRNRFRLVRRPDDARDAEFYHMWFLQPGASGG